LPIKSVTKKFAFSKDEVINLILDIDKYKEFLPWCKNSYIVEKKENDLVKTISANLEIGYKQFADTYTSLVTLDKNKSEISVKHLNGPLKNLIIFGNSRNFPKKVVK
jgi:Oligoketide cyclase/lipid transport protein